MAAPGFDPDAHRIRGSSSDAAAWVAQSALPDDHKALLQQFIARFPSLTFFKDDQALLDHVEQEERVKLPAWFRRQRQTLAFVAPPVHFRIDDFDQLGPRSDTLDRIWYATDLYGYRDDEQRELFLDKGAIFPFVQWPGTDRSVFAISTSDHSDEAIWEFAAEDMLDSVLDGEPAREALNKAFDSYASMLSHIIEIKDASGQVIARTGP
jgi:hypothetical protein